MSPTPQGRASVVVARAGLASAFVIALVAGVAIPASAVPFTSDEVGGSTIAGRAAASDLRIDWENALIADGFTVTPPAIIAATPGDVISGVVATTASGTTVSVERARYSSDALAPTFVEISPNAGIAACTNNGLRLQGLAPRPSVLVGNAGCTNGNGVVYSFSGGAGEGTTRDAVEFTFSRAVAGFGAWFGDLETRTDGFGVPAIARVYGLDGLLLDEWQIVPSIADQSACGSASVGCGNDTTIWLGYAGEPITRMVVIVGDEDAAGNALAEGLSLIGPSTVDVVPTVSVAAGPAPADVYFAGDTVPVVFTVTNTSDVPLQLPGTADCVAPTLLPVGASTQCTVDQVVTQPELDAGLVDVPFSIDGTWEGLSASAAMIASVPLVQSVSFGIDLSANVTEVDTIGDEVEFSAEVTNLGNVSAIPTSVELDGNSLACLPVVPVAPGGSFTCVELVTVSSPVDLAAQSTVTWASGGVTSDATDSALVSWVGPADPGQLPTLPFEPDGPSFTGLPQTGANEDVAWWMLAAAGMVTVGVGALILSRRVAQPAVRAARGTSAR